MSILGSCSVVELQLYVHALWRGAVHVTLICDGVFLERPLLQAAAAWALDQNLRGVPICSDISSCVIYAATEINKMGSCCRS